MKTYKRRLASAPSLQIDIQGEADRWVTTMHLRDQAHSTQPPRPTALTAGREPKVTYAATVYRPFFVSYFTDVIVLFSRYAFHA